MTDPQHRPRPSGAAACLSEYRFVVLIGTIALALTSIPYVVGAAKGGGERIFGGFVYAISDCYSYLAKMRQGAEGAWLFHISYTPEPHPGALFFTFHLLLGKIAALLPGSDLTTNMVWVYHTARWVFGLGLLVTVYRFLTKLTRRLWVRRLAWLMTAFGGGFGWLLIALGQAGWLRSLPLDLILPEGFTFLVLYAFPHIAIARTLLLSGVLAILGAWQTTADLGGGVSTEPQKGSGQGGIRWLPAASLAGLLWLLMGIVVPFYVAVAWAIMGAGCVVLAVRRRRICPAAWGSAAIAALVSSPAVIYSVWRFTSDAVYATWAAQNLVLSPHPLHYLSAFGLPLVLSVLAVLDAWRSERPAWLALAWVGVVPLLIYLPFNLQRRLVEGVQVPLSLLAAMGVARLTDPRSGITDLRSKLIQAVILLIFLPSNLLLVAGNTMALQGRPTPIFRDREETEAMGWLNQQVSPSDVVLASYATGNYLPARVRARAFVGHGPETVEFAEKRAEVARFFDVKTDNAWREGLLERYGIDYLFWGPAERSLGEFDPGTASYLRPAYGAGEYTVFVVELPG